MIVIEASVPLGPANAPPSYLQRTVRQRDAGRRATAREAACGGGSAGTIENTEVSGAAAGCSGGNKSNARESATMNDIASAAAGALLSDASTVSFSGAFST
jgi:hypothetical protein